MIQPARSRAARIAHLLPVPLHAALDRYSSRLVDAETTSDLFGGDPTDAQQYDLELAQRIYERIDSQLPGRIRQLTVYTTENAVVLAGQCSTFYSKQLAQHAAMGVLEYEQLINNIEVRVAK